ncbi:DUF397 domain-containing protein [Nocardiopsis sp. LOL_012]|uniref:DUF397 domain-containing protein n=1 Tax=Nocardiopsis sp. LOL_012 TaxID=3345409 RepID=UPI003A8B3700
MRYRGSGLHFRTSTYSDRSNCVAVADVTGGSVLRDSRHPERGELPFPAAEWAAFLSSAGA